MGRPFELPNSQEGESSSDDEGEGWVEEDSEVDQWDDPSEGGVLSRVFDAAEAGHADELADLLDGLDVSIDTRGADEDTAIHLAALYGHANCVCLLLQKGARADVADGDGALPLHDAAAGGYADICELLLAAAPDTIDRGDSEGDTALHNAARGSHTAVVQLLLQRGAEISLSNDDFKTATQLAERGTEGRQLLDAAEAAAAAAVGQPEVAPPAAEVA